MRIIFSTLLFIMFFTSSNRLRAKSVSETEDKYIVSMSSCKIIIDKQKFRFAFEMNNGKTYPMASNRMDGGVWFGSYKSHITGTELLSDSDGEVKFRLTQKLKDGNEVSTAVVTWYDRPHGLRMSIVPDDRKRHDSIGIRMATDPGPWYGLGDYGGGANPGFGSINQNRYFINMEGKGDERFISSFLVFPRWQMASVHMIQGDERAGVRSQENVYIERWAQERAATNVYEMKHIYFFFGDMKTIYKAFKEAKVDGGYPDTQPHFTFFEGSGWEAWPSLGYNTNQKTALEQNKLFVEKGYRMTWSVIGSGFWEEGGNTTCFGRWGPKYPDPDGMKKWFADHNIKLLFGLRTNTVEGQKEDDELQKLGLLATNPETGKVIPFASAYFPAKGTKHLLDAFKPEAIEWWKEKTLLWGVAGWKEDAMIRQENTTYHYGFANAPMRALNERGDLVMARNAYVASPGSIQRLNDTFGEQERIPKEAIAYGESGAPNVYSDGIGNGSNKPDYLVRHTVLSALTATMAFGKRPWDHSPDHEAAMKMASDWHYEFGPYKYSAALKSYETGYPYTLTPLNIAYADDAETYYLTNKKLWQWMIGESLMAHPVFAHDGWVRDVYLPAGTWMDYQTREVFTGPQMLKAVAHPMNQMPVFVGGKGVIIRRDMKDSSKLYAEIWPIAHSGSSFSYLHYDKKTRSVITNNNTQWDLNRLQLIDSTTGKTVPFTAEQGNVLRFVLTPGHNYQLENK